MRRTLSLFTTAALACSALSVPLAAGASSSGIAHPRHMCIVSLSPTATETLYAIGAGPQVEAVDTDSNFPTTGLPTVRVNPFSPSAEGIATICRTTSEHPSSEPTLVVVSYDANHVMEKLRTLGVQVILQTPPSTLRGAYHQMLKLGRLSGHRGAARRLVAKVKAQIAAAIATVPSHPTKRVTTYWEVSTDPYYSLQSSSFVGRILHSMGVTNIADGVSSVADPGYPELSAEYIVNSDPKLIFLADTLYGGVSVASLARRAGFSTLSAVQHSHVVVINDDIASRWGPRIGILAGQIARGVTATLGDATVWKK
jgi:iron complex transport system substrate-binding protein